MKTKILILTMFVLSRIGLFAQIPGYVPTSGLQGFWPFTGNANDIAGNSYNGTVNGATIGTDRYGNPNTAYCFNGTSDYIVTSYAGILGSNPRAVSFWAKTPGNGGTIGMYPVTWGGNNAGERYGCSLDYPANCTAAGGAICTAAHANSGSSDNNWHHYVFQFSGTSPNNTVADVQIYQDAVLIPLGPGGSGLTTPLITVNGGGYNVQFGKTNYSSNYSWFLGCLDEVGIWNRTLTLCEIYDLYNGAVGCTPPPPLPAEPCCLGNYCADSQNALTGNYEIPLNNFDFNFSGNADDKVNVGYNCGTEGIGKLNSFTSIQTNQNIGSGPESVSIFGDNTYRNLGTGVGVMGVAKNSMSDVLTGKSVGVWGDAIGVGDNTGGKFFAGDAQPQAAVRYNLGVSAVALPSTGNAPAYSYIAAYPGGANIGVYGAGELNNSTPDGSFQGPDWAGWFDGDVNVVGKAYQNQVLLTSDQRFKKDIKALENVGEKIKKLNGYSYTFKADEFKYKGFDAKSHIGLIAQEIKEVFPELVATDAKGFYAVDYQGMIPVLLQAIKEQQIQAGKQQQQIDELTTLVQTLAGSPAKVGVNSLSVTLSDKNAIVLNQNVPNPFAESTVISYNLPADFTKAQIIFTTNDGTVIKTVNITEKGAGSLSVFANDLSHGIYTYSLIVDGKTIDSKKMVKE